MAFLQGKSTSVLYKTYDLSSYFNEATISRSIDVAETTTYGVAGSAKTYVVGQNDGTVSLSGLFDGVAGAVDPVLAATITIDGVNPVTIAAPGLAIGNRVQMLDAQQTSYEVSSPVGDVVSVSAEMQSTGGLDTGVSLHALGAISASETTSASVNNLAASALGGVGHLHVIANTRNGLTTIKIQHSSDNATWSDLITFTDVAISTLNTQRSTSVSTNAVLQYTRVLSTLAGATGTISYNVSFARR
jgi:hypothetical protein